MTSCSSFTKCARIALLIGGAIMGGCAKLNPAPSAKLSAAPPIDVVFVCQYGYAKSLVAAKHFEAMAASRGLPVRVIARGITPTDGVPDMLESALRQDGFEVAGYRPIALEPGDLEGAEYVLTFGVDLPFGTASSTTRWDDVSALSENYTKSRDEIVAHLAEFLDQVSIEERQP